MSIWNGYNIYPPTEVPRRLTAGGPTVVQINSYKTICISRKITISNNFENICLIQIPWELTPHAKLSLKQTTSVWTDVKKKLSRVRKYGNPNFIIVNLERNHFIIYQNCPFRLRVELCAEVFLMDSTLQIDSFCVDCINIIFIKSAIILKMEACAFQIYFSFLNRVIITLWGLHRETVNDSWRCLIIVGPESTESLGCWTRKINDDFPFCL